MEVLRAELAVLKAAASATSSARGGGAQTAVVESDGEADARAATPPHFPTAE